MHNLDRPYAMSYAHQEVDAARILEPLAGKSSGPSNQGAEWIALAASFAFLTSDCRVLIFIQVRSRGPMGPGRTDEVAVHAEQGLAVEILITEHVAMLPLYSHTLEVLCHVVERPRLDLLLGVRVVLLLVCFLAIDV
jgi:hypothetical protein